MADVVGGGTTNVTLYDESGNAVGTSAYPLAAVDRDRVAAGTVQAIGSSVRLGTHDGVSSFALQVTGFTTGSFVFERTLDDPDSLDAAWTAVGAFRSGTKTLRSSWVNTPGAFHGNASASRGVRVRVLTGLDAPATVVLLASTGVGTITIGAIASNEGNIIGAVQTLNQHYASSAGGTVVFDATTDVVTVSSSTEQPIASLINPANSGVDLFVESYEINSTAISTWRRRRMLAAGVTPNEGASSLAIVNRGGGSNTSAALAYRHGSFTYNPALGAVSKVNFVAANSPHEVRLGGSIRLRPGQASVLTATGPGGLGGSMNCTISLDWWELPAS